VLSISEHAYHLNKITWEDLFVSLSRVRKGDHMRLLIKRNDWCTVSYVSDLRRNKYTDLFFGGYVDHPDKDGSMIWDSSLARNRAKLDGKKKLGKKSKKPAKNSTTRRRKGTGHIAQVHFAKQADGSHRAIFKDTAS